MKVQMKNEPLISVANLINTHSIGQCSEGAIVTPLHEF